MIQKFYQNHSCFVLKLNTFLCFMQKFKMAPKAAAKHFLRNVISDSADTMWVKKSVEIDLSCTFFI